MTETEYLACDNPRQLFLFLMATKKPPPHVAPDLWLDFFRGIQAFNLAMMGDAGSFIMRRPVMSDRQRGGGTDGGGPSVHNRPRPRLASGCGSRRQAEVQCVATPQTRQ